MSDPRLVTRGEREPLWGLRVGPVCTFCLAMGLVLLFFYYFPLISWCGGGFLFAQGLRCRLNCLLVAALKVSCVEHMGLLRSPGWAALCRVAGAPR